MHTGSALNNKPVLCPYVSGPTQTSWHVPMGLLPDREYCDCHEPPHSTDECYHSQYSGRQSQPVAICKNTGRIQLFKIQMINYFYYNLDMETVF